MIIITQPNERNGGMSEFRIKRDSVKGLFLFLPVWTLQELLNAKQYFDIENRIDDETIISRYEAVGGVPPHIFTDECDFKSIVAYKKYEVRFLDEPKLHRLTSNHMDAVQTFESGHPVSSLLVYGRTPDDNFQKCAVTVSSQLVLSELVDRHATYMWNRMKNLMIEGGGFGWKIFEAFCRNRMLGKAKKYSKYQYHDGIDLVNKQPKSFLKLGGCSVIKGTLESLVSAAKRNERVLYYSLGTSHEFMDLLYRIGETFYAFQVINAANHTCNPDNLSKFAEEVGVATSKLLLHMLTYDTIYDNFVFNHKHLLNNLHGKDLTINLLRVPKPMSKRAKEY